MDDQLRQRLTRIRDRMTAVGTLGGGPATVESYRALCEVVYAELDSIVTDLQQERLREIDANLADDRRRMIAQGLLPRS